MQSISVDVEPRISVGIGFLFAHDAGTIAPGNARKVEVWSACGRYFGSLWSCLLAALGPTGWHQAQLGPRLRQSCRLIGRLCKTAEPTGAEFRAPLRELVSAYAPEPVLTRPPVPMLAQLEPRLPRGEVWRYEPKLDGFRRLLWRRTTSAVELLSRNGRDLGPWFPELIHAGETLPAGTLLDGEIVIADDEGRVDFTALQVRLSSARKQVARTAFERAAVLVVFDALEIDGLPSADEPLALRREQLERLLEARHPCLQLVEQTGDVNLAEDWLKFLPSIEGVVAKRADRRYAPGQGRDWVKVKRYRTIDCIVIGVAGDLAAPKLVLGLMHPGNLAHHLGRLESVICHIRWTLPG